MKTDRFDFIVVGSGLAGLNAAFNAAKIGSVALITKSSFHESNSYWAQGGIAAVISEEDSFDNHFQDTLSAGRGLCNEETVGILVREGEERIKELINLGLQFDQIDNKFALGMEGGHSIRRILHAEGARTGKAMIDFFGKQIKNLSNITLLENFYVYDLHVEDGFCFGVYGLDTSSKNNFFL